MQVEEPPVDRQALWQAQQQTVLLQKIRGLLIGLVVLVAIPLVLFVLTYLTSV